MISRRDGACPVFLANTSRSSPERGASSPGSSQWHVLDGRGHPSLHQYSVSFLFRGSEEDQDFELFLDVVEPMLQFSFDENN